MRNFRKVCLVLVLIFTMVVLNPVISLAASNKPEVPLVLMGRFTEFLIAMEDGARAVAEQNDIKFTPVDGQGSAEVQFNAVNDFVGKGVDVILLNPIDSEGIVSAVNLANNAGIPIITLDAPTAGGEVASFVGFDNYMAGVICGTYIVASVGGEGKVLEITGPLGAYHANLRHAGFESVIKQYPKIELIKKAADWQADKAFQITQDVFTANPDVKAIYSQNDEMPIGVISALDKIGRLKPIGDPNHVLLVAIDGTPSALDRIRNGIQDATVGQDPVTVGKVAMNFAVKLIKGESIETKFGIVPVLITKDNVDTPEFWGNAYAKK